MNMKTIKYSDDEEILVVKKDEAVLTLNEEELTMLIDLLLDEETQLDSYLDANSATGDDEMWVRLGKLRMLAAKLKRQLP
jgi:3-methyladenine DNA glycosylase/8-oxoguanine DNA glycosylase